MKQIILGLSLISTFLISCGRDESQNIEDVNNNFLNKEYIKNASKNEQLAYKKFYLKEALTEINKLGIKKDDLILLSKNSQDKNTVLLSDIFSELKKNSKQITKETENHMKVIENAFKDLDGDSYEISFYIPFNDTLMHSNNNKTISNDIYIFEQEDNSEQIAFKGEMLNEDGEYVTYEQLITEEMAENFAAEGRAVVIVGLQDLNYTGGNGGTNNPPSNSYRPFFNIYNMAIKQHKESWIGGMSEITFDGHMTAGGFIGRINSLWNWNFYGEYNFYNVTRKSVRDQKLFQVNRSLGYIYSEQPNAQFYTPVGNDDYSLNYVIYEKDNWPTGNRSVSFNYKGKSSDITYRSSDTPYDYRSIVGHPLISPTYYIDNEGIKYNYGYGSNELR